MGLGTRTWLALAFLCSCAADPSAPGGNDAPVSQPPTAAFELLTVTPDVAAPLSMRAPLVLQFSAPVDPNSVTSGVRLEAAGQPVQFKESVEGAQLSLDITNPPPAPTTVTLTISESLLDTTRRGAQPTTRSWQLPLWLSHSADGASGRAPKLAHALGVSWLAWEGEAAIQLAEHTAQGLRNVEALPVEAGAVLSDLVIDAQGHPVIAWRGATAHVARYSAAGWQALDAGIDAALAAGPELLPRLAVGGAALWLAWPTSTGVELFTAAADAPFQRVAPATTAPPLGLDLSWSPAGAVLGVLVDNAGQRDLQVLRLEAGAWRTLSEALDHSRADDVPELAVDVGSDGSLLVAWAEVSDGLRRPYLARFSDAAGSFERLGAALNVGLENDTRGIALAAGSGVAPAVAFQELSAGEVASYVGQWRGNGVFAVLGGSLGGRGTPGLALEAHAQPLAALARADTGGIELHEYNTAPPQHGLGPRKAQPCTLPGDADPAFPKLLSQTRCYADIATKTAAEGWVPYDLNSPLWSDGAYKRRFFAIPDNTTIGFTAADAWEMPVGTMLAKEFWLQRDPADPTSRFIVETRLMIKRCEPGSCRASWQGYSYQWNATGDEATLLDNNSETVYVDWPVAGGMHTHSYPGRDECTRCHALSAGGALGLRTQQLNRNHRYSEVVDHQLRALFHAGFFGDAQEPNGFLRLPTPSDPAFDLNAQVRGYFDANCSHCHSPTSRWPVVDLRFDAQLRGDDGTGTTGNICNMLVPGDAEASILYVKLKARPGAVPEGFPGDTMPPIARLVPDEAQLPRIKGWIDRMTTCP